ncbi:carbamoyltransferase HypF, partial [Pseudomonas sp. SIMBA_064]
YDRARTTMRGFAMCPECAEKYSDPTDRRFHAQPIACHVCGPRAWIERLGPGTVNHEAFSMMDDVDAAGGMLMNGHIVAIKGLGG